MTRVLVKAGSSDSRGRREGRIVRTIAEEPREIVGRYFVEQVYRWWYPTTRA